MCVLFQMDRRWMYHEKRVTEAFMAGVTEFLQAVKEYMVHSKNKWVTCPCKDYKKMMSTKDLHQIQGHLIKRGFVSGYTCWTNHGEDQITEDDDYYEEQSAGQCQSNTYMDDDTFMHDVEDTTIYTSTGDHETQASQDTSQVDKPEGERDTLSQMLRDNIADCMDDKLYKKYLGMIEDSEKGMYPGCKLQYSKLATVLEILQMKEKAGWSDKSVTMSLTFLEDFLPEGNHMPKSM